jgi:hypothetical protein
MPTPTFTATCHVPFLQQLRDAADAVHAPGVVDPWEHKLRNLKGQLGHDGVERVHQRRIRPAGNSDTSPLGPDRAAFARNEEAGVEQHPRAWAEPWLVSGSGAGICAGAALTVRRLHRPAK